MLIHLVHKEWFITLCKYVAQILSLWRWRGGRGEGLEHPGQCMELKVVVFQNVVQTNARDVPLTMGDTALARNVTVYQKT